MKKLAVISEFNPFHKGHGYLIRKARQLVNPSLTLAFMSGDFVQRGEPAIIDKFKRAQSAINNGFDLVAEMPDFISLQSAEFFARKSIEILSKIPIDYLAFGIENINEDDFIFYAQNLLAKEEILEDKTSFYLSKNLSFTTARYKAVEEIIHNKAFISSNNILGFEYIRSINKINPNIIYLPIKRIGSNNKDLSIEDKDFASSSAIRNNISENIANLMPQDSYGYIRNLNPQVVEDSSNILFEIFKYKLLIERYPMEEILAFEQGHDNFFRKILKEPKDYQTFLKDCESLRSSRARIKRLIINYLLENKINLNNTEINFLKILAFNKEKSSMLGDVAKNMDIILRKSESNKLDKDNQEIYKNMVKASDLYSLIRRDYLAKDYNHNFKKG
ncbi:MAG: nucleotidyltransferase family protein [Anaerococcus sp.]|nr:nucleotidyltransferase family protein [Anaerococcus sp.]